MADYANFGNGTYFDRVKNIGAVNGRETRDYNEYLRMGGKSIDTPQVNYSTGYTQPADPIELAKKAQQLQIEANQPAIQTLNTQKSTLDAKYDDLLKSITGSEQVASQAQTRATSSELAKRGITSDSGIAQQEEASAQLPVSTQFGQLKANTGLSREQDLTNLAAQIAALQAGNVPGALSFSTGVGSLQNQAQSIANQFTLGQESNAIQREANSRTQQPDRYIAIPGGGLLDTQTGQKIQGIDAIKSSVNNNSGW